MLRQPITAQHILTLPSNTSDEVGVLTQEVDAVTRSSLTVTKVRIVIVNVLVQDQGPWTRCINELGTYKTG